MTDFLNNTPVIVNRIEDNRINLESISEGKERVTFDEESINRQKNCVPGPNVRFGKKSLPFSEYISNMTTPGTLGCNSEQYPKYTNGKYCCETEMATPQEQLDYVNMLLENAIKNVSVTAFKKYSTEINWLRSMRNHLLQKYREKNLEDKLKDEFPITINGKKYENLDSYFLDNLSQSTVFNRDLTHKERFQGRDDIETNINSSINEIRYRPTSIPLNKEKSKYYNSVEFKQGNKDENRGGKRKYSRNCKTMKRRKTVRKSQRKSTRGERTRSKRLIKK
jgi:hypothetical protein